MSVWNYIKDLFTSDHTPDPAIQSAEQATRQRAAEAQRLEEKLRRLQKERDRVQKEIDRLKDETRLMLQEHLL
jgi:peptidoglycan hydrolase CwlO-like protein